MVKNRWTFGRFDAEQSASAERNPRPLGAPYDRVAPWSCAALPIAEYARCVLAIAETVHCWLTSLVGAR